MVYIIMTLVIVTILITLIILLEKTKLKLSLVLKILAVVLIVTYLGRLIGIRVGYVDELGNRVIPSWNEYFDTVFNIFQTDIITEADAKNTWINGSKGLSTLLVFLRWGTGVIVVWTMIAPFFKQKRINQIIGYLGIPMVVLNIIFFKDNVIAIQSNMVFSFRYIQFMIETIILASIAGLYLYNDIKTKIKEKEKVSWKGALLVLGIFGGTAFAVMPQSTLSNLFGYIGKLSQEGVLDTVAADFNLYHLVFISLPFLIIIVTFLIMRNKSKDSINAILLFYSVAAVVQYFYVRRSIPWGLPLHLCNAAVIMILVSMIFNHRGSFYFSFFANVLGALLAILIPNYTANPFSISTIHFTFNHMFAVAIPILGVALKKFGRPKMKDMYSTILVFSIYFFSTIIINAWLKTDYFFTYGNFLTSKFRLTPLKEQLSFTFMIGKTSFTIFYFYQMLYYVVFIGLMFLTWFIYDHVFKASDGYQEMKNKNIKHQLDILELTKLLDGRSVTEPLNLEGINMIEIKRFSKRYGKSAHLSVDNFSLEVHAGEVFGFLGHNGAGKSTTIKSMVGIQSITEGEILICGYSIKSQPMEAKLNIGYVSDNHAVYEKLTGREYVNYVADLYQVRLEDRNKRLEEYLDKFALRDAIDRQIKSYSHGMKQKLVVISSLIHDPKVWILDEPLTGLDPTSAFQIKETMREHANKGNIVFFSSHVIEVVERVCDRIAIIGHGKLEGVYVINDLIKDNMSLEQLYMDNVTKHQLLKKG